MLPALPVVSDYPSHSYVIDIAEMRNLGFENVTELNSKEVVITNKMRELFLREKSSIIKLLFPNRKGNKSVKNFKPNLSTNLA